jgi:eukaryotic-like serine/threonine-protein kinase
MSGPSREGRGSPAIALSDPDNPSDPAPEEGPVQGPSEDPFIGQRIGNCWIVAKLGEGGFGTVYRAIDEETERPVAVKIVKPERASNEEVIRKFLRGAIAAAQIEHENVVGIFRIGRDERYKRHYIVMEHLKGRTLQVVLDERGPLPAREVIPWILQAAAGLHAAHEKSILHRDLKPDNIMISAEGVVKITDLGLARQMDRNVKTTKVMGTPHFMAPEQFEGKGMDRRTDVYGLGITLYYLLSHQFPYEGKTSMQIVFSILTTPPKPLMEVLPGAPPELWAIIQRMIARVQAERYPTVAEAAADLRAFHGTLPPPPA